MAKPLTVHEQILERVERRAALHLSTLGLQGLAESLRGVWIEDHMTNELEALFRVWLWGSNFEDVYFERTITVPMPATWWDHLKLALCYRLGWRRPTRLELAYTGPQLRQRAIQWLKPRIRYSGVSETVTDHRKVATHLCPHVSIPVPEGQDIHLAWLDGNEALADEMREEWECRR